MSCPENVILMNMALPILVPATSILLTIVIGILVFITKESILKVPVAKKLSNNNIGVGIKDTVAHTWGYSIANMATSENLNNTKHYGVSM